MGDILTEARKEDIEKMSRDIASQAVELVGLVDISSKPFDWIRQRLRTAMNVLVRITQRIVGLWVPLQQVMIAYFRRLIALLAQVDRHRRYTDCSYFSSSSSSSSSSSIINRF